jgi:hypothetical protein
MAYIIKNTSGLLNTRFTDIGRQKLSQGKFNVTYFQIGDSEVLYDSNLPTSVLTNNYILEAAYTAHSNAQTQTNKMNIKYPFYVNGTSGNTYGLPIQDSQVYSVYNSAEVRGFFTGQTGEFSALTSSAYTITSNYTYDTCALCSGNSVTVNYDFCDTTSGTPAIGDFVTLYFDGNGGCGDIVNNFPVLTYKIQGLTPSTGTTGQTSWIFELDRPTPQFSGAGCCGNARVLVYPSGMTQLYDTTTPMGYWPPDVINFQSVCDLGNTDVLVWNMNIPWSVNPAGITVNNEGYTKFGSVEYLGSKEYFGYQETTGQTFWVNSTLTAETTDTFYYNSFDNPIKVQPYEQKAIAIVHYTNNAIDSFYGEKFAFEPYAPNAVDHTGEARNFKVTLPTLMWHKSKTGYMGETFYVDPNVGAANFFQVKYMKSSLNTDMNDPGLRYYHLWDTHLNNNGSPSRVGKVFPDLKTIVFDDEEIIAALSYKSDRNWTLPAPSVTLSTPNLCDTNNDDAGILSGDTEYMYITYRFNSTGLTNPLHCNYYTKVQGPKSDCNLEPQNVSVKFGDEFPFMTNVCFSGFNATEFEILAQVVTGSTTQPDPSEWKIINYTSQLSATTVGGYLSASGVTGATFTITHDLYVNAPFYDLSDYIELPLPTEPNKLNFGDEYYFYGNIETDIQATIYEMRFLCNLPSTQFNNTSNPTWKFGNPNYVTEIGLYDSDKNLLVITKNQSPQLRQGTQQYAIKLDF